jgi:hypothetical protein
MSTIEVEQGKRYYCEVVGASEPLAGTFAISGGDIRASMVRFDAFLSTERDAKELYLRTEEDWIVSMFDLIPGGWRQRGAGAAATYIQDTTSNLALIGPDAWSNSDRVWQLSFRIPGLDQLFRNSKHFSQILDSEMFSMPDLIAFNVAVGDMRLKAWLAPSGGLQSARPTSIKPWFHIEFENGRTLEQMRWEVRRVVRFFSLCSGEALQASYIKVSRSSTDEDTQFRSEHKVAPEHQVFAYGDSEHQKVKKIKPHSTLVSLWTPDNRAALEASLAAWIERDAEWSAAAAMAMQCLSNQGVMSSSRLMNAAIWLEEIPGAQPRDVMKVDHAKALGKLVGREAKKMGYGALAGRFRQAISRIALETNRDRLSRLTSTVRVAFGEDVLDEHTVDWLIEAFAMRGRAAHGVKTALDDEPELFYTAVEALECISALLMLKDLPLGDEVRSRIDQHLLVRQYRQQSIWGSPKMRRMQLQQPSATAAEG